MQACYYEEHRVLTTPKPRHQNQHKQQKQQKQQKSKQRRQLQEQGTRESNQAQYNRNGVQHSHRRRQEPGRRQQALRYLNEAQHHDGFLHPPMAFMPTLIPPPPFFPVMAHARMLHYMPQI
jgi:hypothetical protein